MRRWIGTLALLALAGGCGDDGGSGGRDAGGGGGFDATVPPGTDGGPIVPPEVDAGTVMFPDGGSCTPTVEICGDRMDQNCDGRDTGCGDTDMDGVQACRAGDDLTMCDCDDARRDVRPPRGAGVPGAPEICDGRDNDCNGRIDESAECCAGCASLGAERSRADTCDATGACDCSTEPGVGPCASGQTCCTNGCTDLRTDAMNCGFCGAACTVSADRCTAGECRCGAGPVCDLDTMCSGGSC